MTTYYVATLACYVLVEAKDETQAREKGHVALRELYATLRQTNEEVPIEIRIVRKADEDENEHWTWHQNMIRAEGER